MNERQNVLKKITSTTDNTSGTVIISVVQIIYVPLPYYPYELLLNYLEVNTFTGNLL